MFQGLEAEVADEEPRDIEMEPESFREMIEHLKAHAPNEACGILAGTDGRVVRVYPMTNVEPTPYSYFMDPKEQFAVMKEMRKEGLSLVGIYHSHPATTPYPSRKDRDLAFYPEAATVIVSFRDPAEPEARAYRIVEDRVTPIPLVVRPRRAGEKSRKLSAA